MTSEQFERFLKSEQDNDRLFMDTAFLLRCACGRNIKATIINACEKDWIVTTRRRIMTEVKCPMCAPTSRRKLEKDIAAFYKGRN